MKLIQFVPSKLKREVNNPFRSGIESIDSGWIFANRMSNENGRLGPSIAVDEEASNHLH